MTKRPAVVSFHGMGREGFEVEGHAAWYRHERGKVAEKMEPLNIYAACQRIIDARKKPTLPEVRPIIAAWYARPGNESGGELHCELDDGNLERHFLVDGYEDRTRSKDARIISYVLLMLSPSQRRRL